MVASENEMGTPPMLLYDYGTPYICCVLLVKKFPPPKQKKTNLPEESAKITGADA